MDRMNAKQRVLTIAVIGWCFSLVIRPVWAMAIIPSYSASPSGTKSVVAPSPTPTPVFPKRITCSVTSSRGLTSLAPATVNVAATGTVDGTAVTDFRFNFGDGEIATGSGTQNHYYGQAGIYTVTAQPVISTSATVPTCKTKVVLTAAPLVPHTSACTEMQLAGGRVWTVSQPQSVSVTGVDNKGTETSYRLEADGTVWEQATGDFSVAVATPGAYTLKAFIKDTVGNWVGGSGKCMTNIKVNQPGITSQPATGPSSVYWTSLGGLFLIWLGAQVWYRKHHPSIG